MQFPYRICDFWTTEGKWIRDIKIPFCWWNRSSIAHVTRREDLSFHVDFILINIIKNIYPLPTQIDLVLVTEGQFAIWELPLDIYFSPSASPNILKSHPLGRRCSLVVESSPSTCKVLELIPSATEKLRSGWTNLISFQITMPSIAQICSPVPLC